MSQPFAASAKNMSRIVPRTLGGNVDGCQCSPPSIVRSTRGTKSLAGRASPAIHPTFGLTNCISEGNRRSSRRWLHVAPPSLVMWNNGPSMADSTATPARSSKNCTCAT
jgi:hypothetical protein